MRTKTKLALEYSEQRIKVCAYQAFVAGWDAREPHIRILIDALKDTIEHSTDVIAQRRSFEALNRYEETLTSGEQPQS